MRLRRGLIALAFAATLASLAVPSPAFAQAPAIFGRPVVSVALDVVGNADYSQAALARLDTRPGQPFTYESYRRSVERLEKLGFEDTEVLVEAVAGGVRVIFRVVPPHPVTDIALDGETGLSPGDLKRRVLERYGGMPAGVAAELVKNTVIDVLREEGYAEAAATVEVERFGPPERATLRLHVAAGALVEIGEVAFEGRTVEPWPEGRVLRAAGAVVGEPYRPRVMGEALEKIAASLRSKRFFTARAEHLAEPLPDGRWAVTVILEAGPLVELRWDRTADAPPPGDIGEYVPVAQQNSVDRDLLDDGARRIETALRRDGYRDAAVIVQQEATAGRLVVTYAVRRGPRYRVEAVALPAGLALPAGELTAALEVGRGDVYDEEKVAAGLNRILAEYYARGYYRASASASRTVSTLRAPTPREVWVIVHVAINEGVIGRIADVRFVRDTAQVPDADLLEVMSGRVGQPYVPGVDAADQAAIERLYANRGFLLAEVSVAPAFSDDGRAVTRQVRIVERQQLVVQSIMVVGRQDISERAIREELLLYEGGPFGENLRLESQRRVYNMGVFRRVSIDPETPPGPDDTGVHVVVRVVEAPDTTVSFGGGVEGGRRARSAEGGGLEDRLELSPRGFFGIGRRNLGGRNRGVDLFTRVSLRPRDAPNDPERDGRGYRFSEYRAVLTYREQRAFHTDTLWLTSASSERAIRTGFNFVRQSANLEMLRVFTPRTSGSVRFAVDFTRLFDVRFGEDERLEIDRVFPQVRLSIFAIGVITDHRDDPISPARGTFTTLDAEVAARAIGSEVGYGKVFWQTSGYRALNRSRRVVAAARTMFGVARGFERSVNVQGATGSIADLPASQRFFAGGSTTVRGFQLDRLGAARVLTDQGLSLGGNALVVFNAELRTVVARLFGRRFTTVQFADAGNVFAKASDVSLRTLRGAVGMGFRYDSPLGPIRLDFGYKLSRLTFSGRRERAWEYHLSFGEAF